MADTPELEREGSRGGGQSMADNAPDLHAWFVREVLPLEPALTKFLQRYRRNQSDVADVLQDIYLRVYHAAREQLPEATRSFVFVTAYNLLIDRVRREKVIPLEIVESIEAMGVAAEVPGVEESVIAREELRRVQAALDCLPPRSREAIVLRQIDGLSRREIAARMGISEQTVKWHLNAGVRALADIFYGNPESQKGKP
jgi:RNA polymerase sigma factor (sigma-70 family)